MRWICRGLILPAPVLFSFVAVTQAQSAAPKPPPRPDNSDITTKSKSSDERPNLGTIDEEMRAKQSLRALEKEYKDNVQRAREAAELSGQLLDALKHGVTFGRDETKKLDRLEKLAKKIRDEAGGSDEETLLESPPGKLESALSRLADVADTLYKTLQKTPRQVISASIIENANKLLKLAKLTRNLFN
jgi:hypothetical protein